jgi:hypothetical protein
VPPTALTLLDESPWLSPTLSDWDKARADRCWAEWYFRDGLPPQVDDGHIVVSYNGLVGLAIYLGVPMIEVRTYFFDGEK